MYNTIYFPSPHPYFSQAIFTQDYTKILVALNFDKKYNNFTTPPISGIHLLDLYYETLIQAIKEQNTPKIREIQKFDIREIEKAAVQTLIGNLNNANSVHTKHILPFQVIIRQIEIVYSSTSDRIFTGYSEVSYEFVKRHAY